MRPHIEGRVSIPEIVWVDTLVVNENHNILGIFILIIRYGKFMLVAKKLLINLCNISSNSMKISFSKNIKDISPQNKLLIND